MENKKNRAYSLQKGLFALSSAAVIAASSGFAWQAPAAFAAATEAGSSTDVEPAAAAASANGSDFYKLFVQRHLHSMLVSAAAASETEFGDVLASIRDGRSLAEATGETAASLREAVLDDFVRTLELEVGRGALSPSQAEQARQAVEEFIGRAISGSWSAAASVFAFPEGGEDIVDRRLASIVHDAAVWSDRRAIDVRLALRDGLTLTAAATPAPKESDSDGDDNSALYERMTLPEYLADLLEQDLDRSVETGWLTAEEAASLREQGAAEISRILTVPGYEPEATEWMVRFGEELVNDRIASVRFDTALLSDESIGDALSALDRGDSLASVADMSESELTGALVAKAEESIEAAWRAGAITSALADRLKQDAASLLEAAVNPAPAAAQTAEGDAAVAAASVRRIVEQSAHLGKEELTPDELRAALAAGGTIAQAVDVEEGELMSSLQWSADRYIDGEVTAGRLAPGAAEPTKAMARDLLAKAVSTPGYTVKVDAKAYAKERLDRILTDAAALAALSEDEVLSEDELLRRLAQGDSMTEAVGMSKDDLLYKLADALNRELIAFVKHGGMTEEESAQALSAYMEAVRESIR